MAKNKLLLISFLLSLALIFRQLPDQYVHLIFCDVGQGDAILITQGYFQLLVDGGPDDKVMSCIRENVPFWDSKIEVIMASHADADHITGLVTVLKNYDFDYFFLNDLSGSEVFAQLVENIRRKDGGQRLKQPVLGQSISFSESIYGHVISETSNFTVTENQLKKSLTEIILSDNYSANLALLAEENEKEESHNDRSIVLLLTIGQIDVLLTGDISQDIELALLQKQLIRPVEVLKVAHHGSKTSNGAAFLQSLQTEISVISCGQNNKFGHPNSEIIENLRKIGSKIYRTDELGTIHFVTNGKKIWLLKKMPFLQ